MSSSTPDRAGISLSLHLHDGRYSVQLQQDENTWTEDLDSFGELQAFTIGVGAVMAALVGVRWWRKRHD